MDIHTASSLGDEEYTKKIIKMRRYLSIDIKNSRGWTPLMYASWGGHEVVARLLVEAGASTQKLNKKKQPALILAVAGGSLNIVRLVCQNNLVNHVDSYGKTALCYAVEYNYLDIAKYLLAEGANVDCSSSEASPLSIAREGGYGFMLELLLKHVPQYMPVITAELDELTMAPSKQGVTDLEGFLSSISLDKYLPIFQSNNIDLQEFLKMDEADLKSIGIVLLGPRRKMYLSIQAYIQSAIL